MAYRNAFGALFSTSNSDIPNSVNFLMHDSTQSTIIYPVGRHIGVRNIETNDMRFIRQNENLKEITAMCLCPHKRFLAVCERHKNNLSAFIAFYDMKNVQFRNEKNYINVCDVEPTNQKTIKSISFSADSKYIAVILEGPDYTAMAWDWHNKNKSRIIGQFDFGKTVINKITFNPNDNHQVCTSGHNHWKLWRVQENTFKPMPTFQGVGTHLFTDHCWLMDDRLAACTAEGEIIILEEYQQKQVIENAFMSEDIYNISCIKPYSKGFFIASDNGIMALWVRSEENNQSTNKENQLYDYIRRWSPTVTKGTKIISMDVNTSEEYVAAACQNNNIALVNIKSVGLNDANTLSRDVKCDLICKGFHSGPITCIDIAVQRPIIVT
jgi:WD40 repeat protein